MVTGGTRGLGKAIAIALKADSDRAAAVYHGNDKAAQAFHEEEAIPVYKWPGLQVVRPTSGPAYKWDVSNYDACDIGLNLVQEELGPADILVNNAGITRDATPHRMIAEQWWEVIVR